ncbi:thiol:disulfide interchange protein DsbA/DsbL [Chitinimonas lacunae]|uniref:Thiol:disulfide interchange protein n=1 Tax=Chitinimonas lacunae TaxID=1963018 RepID=A0ABV8MMG4_9NEIS
MHLPALFGRFVMILSLLFVGRFALADDGHGHEPVVTLTKPQPVATPGKIEVIEFFWYGCPACNATEPAVEAWEKTLPKDVVFRREHVLWTGRSDMDGHAKLFNALSMLNLLPTHHRAVFDAIHRDKLELRDQDTLAKWVAQRGIDQRRFMAAYQAFDMNARLDRARKFGKDYQLQSVPSFVVNGKYLTSPGAVGDPQKMFALIDQLIARERKLIKR